MAPPAITEDYYVILELDQTAGPELIARSYRRLALKLHPDRNSKRDATEAFQRLGRAYNTLKDESEFVPKSTDSETAQIAVLRKSKQERAARWQTSKMAFDTSIFEVERFIRRLEQEINGLNSISAAEAAEKAHKNSWSTWILSPIFKKTEDSDDVKAQKDRARQERRVEKDMKERRLVRKRADFGKIKTSMEESKAEMNTANTRDDAKIQELQNTIWRKESWQRQERERAEREKRV